MPNASFTPQPQGEPCAGSSPVLPAEAVETVPELVQGGEPDITDEQLSAEENVTLPDMTNGTPAMAEDDGNGETAETQQLNNKPTGDTDVKNKESGNITDGEQMIKTSLHEHLEGRANHLSASTISRWGNP